MLYTNQIKTDNALTIHLTGELTYRRASVLKSEFKHIATEKGNHIILDLADVTLLDGSGLGAIAHLLHKVKQHGGHLHLEGLRGQPMRLLSRLGLFRVLCQ